MSVFRKVICKLPHDDAMPVHGSWYPEIMALVGFPFLALLQLAVSLQLLIYLLIAC